MLPAMANDTETNRKQKPVESKENSGKYQRDSRVNTGENNRTGSVLRPMKPEKRAKREGTCR